MFASSPPPIRTTCPRCKAAVNVVRNRLGEWTCAICGGPVVVVTDPKVLRSETEFEALERTRRSRFKSRVLRAGSVVLGTAGLFASLVLAAIWWLAAPSLLIALFAVGFVLGPWGLGFWALRRANALDREARASYEEAQLMTALAIARTFPDGVTGPEIASILQTTDEQTDRLLARLNSEASIESRVNDEGELVFVERSLERVRVEDADFGTRSADPLPYPGPARARKRGRNPN